MCTRRFKETKKEFCNSLRLLNKCKSNKTNSIVDRVDYSDFKPRQGMQAQLVWTETTSWLTILGVAEMLHDPMTKIKRQEKKNTYIKVWKHSFVGQELLLPTYNIDHHHYLCRIVGHFPTYYIIFDYQSCMSWTKEEKNPAVMLETWTDTMKTKRVQMWSQINQRSKCGTWWWYLVADLRNFREIWTAFFVYGFKATRTLLTWGFVIVATWSM